MAKCSNPQPYPNCTRIVNWLDDSDSPPPLEGNGDISGTGVIVAFLSTGYLVFILLLCYYLVVFDPEDRGSQTDGDQDSIKDEGGYRPNPIDIGFLAFVRRHGRYLTARLPPSPLKVNLEGVLSLSILNLCDAQILTGIGFLVSGLLSLHPKCGKPPLSTYHWQMIVHFAWFACATQLSGLTIIRIYLLHRPWQRNVRSALMSVLIILTLVGLVPTAFFDWNGNYYDPTYRVSYPAAPAVCYFDPNIGSLPMTSGFELRYYYQFLNNAGQSAIFSIVLLGVTFITRAVKVYKPLSKAMNGWLRIPLSKLVQKVLRLAVRVGRGSRVWNRLVVIPMLAIFLALRLFVDLLTSTLSEVYLLALFLTWGTLRFFATRGAVPEDTLEEESQWTFGQILPLLLLATPLFNLFGLAIAKSTLRRTPVPANNAAVVRGDEEDEENLLKEPNHRFSAHRMDSDMTLCPPDPLTHPEVASTHPEVNHLGLDDPASSWADRDYYKTPWMGMCALSLCAAYIYLSIQGMRNLFPIEIDFKTNMTLISFWIGQGYIHYFFIGMPAATAFTILLGLTIDGFFRRGITAARLIGGIFMFLFIQLIYFLPTLILTTTMMVYFSIPLSPGIPELIISGAFYLIYCSIQGFRGCRRKRRSAS